MRRDEVESPVDLAHKEEFTLPAARKQLVQAGFEGIASSRHDFLAYPLSGNYLLLLPGRSRSLMSLLLRVERILSAVPLLGWVLGVFAWRILIVSVKPAS